MHGEIVMICVDPRGGGGGVTQIGFDVDVPAEASKPLPTEGTFWWIFFRSKAHFSKFSGVCIEKKRKKKKKKIEKADPYLGYFCEKVTH